MPMDEGTVLTYRITESTDKNKTSTYTSTVVSVEELSDGVTKVELVDRHDSSDTPFGDIEQNSSYIYDKSTGMTKYIAMTSDEFKRMSMSSVRAMVAQSGGYFSEQQYEELEKAMKPKGELVLVLSNEVAEGQSFPNSTIRCSLMGQSMGMKIVKGTYGGFEDISVEGGTFKCLKLSYTLAMIGEGADTKVTGWYAEGIGCVKQVTTDKKGKTLSVEELVSVSIPGRN